MRTTRTTATQQTSLWSKALQSLRSRVTAEDWAEISGVVTPEEVTRLVNQLEQKYTKQRIPRYLVKCRRVIEGFRPFMTAVDQYAQVVPQGIGCLAWGSLRIVIEVSPSLSVFDGVGMNLTFNS